MAINPLEFNERAAFGSYQVVTNEVNGNQTNTFVTAFNRWFGYRTQSLTQQYTLMGNKLVDTKLIAIRHDDAVTKQMIVQIGNDDYNCLIEGNKNNKRTATGLSTSIVGAAETRPRNISFNYIVRAA